jgi:hypothetical protein
VATSPSEPPTVVAEPDGTVTAVFLRPDGIGHRMAARVRAPSGGWSPVQDLSEAGLSTFGALPFLGGDHAAAGPNGGVVAVWARTGGSLSVVQAARKPAGATTFEAAQDISEIGRQSDGPHAAVAPDGEAVAVWTSRPTALLFDQSVVQAASHTGRPGAVLEPPAVAITRVQAPARAAAGTIVRLTATFAAYVDPARVTVQRLAGGSFVDVGPAVTVRGTTASLPVRLLTGRNVLRLVYDDRGSPADTPPVTVQGTRPAHPLVAAGDRPGVVRMGLGSVWVLSEGADDLSTVMRIDPRTRRAVGAPVAVGRARGLAVGAGAVWVAAPPLENPGLRRIDPATMRVTAEVPIETDGSVAVGAGGVWTIHCGRRGAIHQGDCGEQHLVMVDPATNAVARSVEVVRAFAEENPSARVLSVDAGVVWLNIVHDTGRSGGLAPYDAATLQPLPRVAVPNGALATSGATVWSVTGMKCLLSRGTARGAVVGKPVRLPDVGRFACGTVVAGPRDVWVGQSRRSAPGRTPQMSLPSRIVRLDARTRRTVGVPIGLGLGPFAFAVGEGAVWVAYPEAGVVARIDPGPAARTRPRPSRPQRVPLAGGAWTGRRTLSSPVGTATLPALVAGRRGRTVAVWSRQLSFRETAIESAVRPGPGSSWRPARRLDTTGGVAFGSEPRVAAAATGEAVASWAARGRVWTSVLGPRADRWSAAEARTPADGQAASPALVMGPDGTAVALFTCRCPAAPGVVPAQQAAVRPPRGAFGVPAVLSDAAPFAFLGTRLAAGPAGAALAAWATGPPVPGLLVAERRPDGTWSAPMAVSRVTDPVTGFVSDPQVAMNGRGDAIAVWRQGGELMAARRPASGAWSAPEELPGTADVDSGPPQVAIDDAGTVLVVVRSFDEETFNHRVAAIPGRPDGGWGAPVVLSPAGPRTGPPAPSAGMPSLALDRRGRAVVVWAQQVNGALHVLARRRASPDGGWGRIEAVSGPAPGARDPQVALDPSGAAVAVWLERTAPRVRGGQGTMVVRGADSPGRP